MKNQNLDKFNDFPGLIEDEYLHKAAVIIPLVKVDGKDHILFEIRSNNVNSQKGDACFPGGSLEDMEKPIEAAIRECKEELLVKDEQIQVLKSLKLFHRMSLLIYPFLARIDNYDYHFDEEVESVFTVPLDFFKENEPKRYQTNWTANTSKDFPLDLINGGKDYAWPKHVEDHLCYQYEDKVIWGYSAKLIYYNLELIEG